MVYGNNGDSFELKAGSDGRLYLKRNGLDTACPRQEGWLCCDDCALFQRHHDDFSDRTEAHLCCCTPYVVIRITDKEV
jgi:hypothetical protein